MERQKRAGDLFKATLATYRSTKLHKVNGREVTAYCGEQHAWGIRTRHRLLTRLNTPRESILLKTNKSNRRIYVFL